MGKEHEHDVKRSMQSAPSQMSQSASCRLLSLFGQNRKKTLLSDGKCALAGQSFSPVSLTKATANTVRRRQMGVNVTYGRLQKIKVSLGKELAQTSGGAAASSS